MPREPAGSQFCLDWWGLVLLAAGRGSSRCGGLAAVLGADTWTGSGAPRLCGPGPACPLRPGFRPTHYTERTWSGGMAPPARPQDRAAAPPSSQQLPSSPSPLLNLTPDQPLLVESLPIWVHSCKAPPAPLEFPALHFRSRPSSADNCPASGGGAEDPLPALRHRKQSPRAEQAGLAGDFTCS